MNEKQIKDGLVGMAHVYPHWAKLMLSAKNLIVELEAERDEQARRSSHSFLCKCPLKLNKAYGIQGWMSHAELHWLATMASTQQVIVEVGSFLGRSTRALGDNCPGVVHAVDPWPDEVAAADVVGQVNDYPNKFIPFQKNLDDLILTGKVISHRTTFVPGLFPPASVDMVFIDGDHSEQAVLNDITIALGILRPGGVLSGHDYDPRDLGVVRAVNHVFGGGEKAGLHASIWWGYRP
jgi:predicted O-methyltransferase YrrM